MQRLQKAGMVLCRCIRPNAALLHLILLLEVPPAFSNGCPTEEGLIPAFGLDRGKFVKVVSSRLAQLQKMRSENVCLLS